MKQNCKYLYALLILLSIIFFAEVTEAAQVTQWYYLESYNIFSQNESDIVESAMKLTKYQESQQNNLFKSDATISGWNYLNLEKMPDFNEKVQCVWVTTKLTDEVKEANTLLLKTTGSDITVWLNQKPIYIKNTNSPINSKNTITNWHFIKLPIQEDDKTPTLTIEMKGNVNELIGTFDYFSLDSPQKQTIRIFLFDLPFILVIPIGLLIMMILAIYYKSVASYKILYIWLITFTGLIIAWMVLMSSIRQLYVGNNNFLNFMQYLSTYILPITANMVLYEIIEPKRQKYIEIAEYILLVVTTIAFANEILGNAGFYYGLKYYYIIMYTIEFIILLMIIKSAREGNKYSRAILLPTLFIPLLGVIDGIHHLLRTACSNIYLLPLGFIFLIYFVFFIIKQQIFQEKIIEKKSIELEYKAAVATEKMERDPLTSCYNRTKFNKIMDNIIKTEYSKLSFIILDVDNFKHFNDTYGHKAGDIVLKNIVKVIKQQTDKTKAVFRWGGEEFVILCYGMDIQSAIKLSNFIRRKVALSDIYSESIVTISIGVSEWHGKKADNIDELFKRADEALLRAKKDGRNCVRQEIYERTKK